MSKQITFKKVKTIKDVYEQILNANSLEDQIKLIYIAVKRDYIDEKDMNSFILAVNSAAGKIELKS